jgi:hypothetical protein
VNELKIKKELIPKVNRMLYVSLLQYTKNDTHGKVVSNGANMALESYRYIHPKGTSGTVMNKMKMETKAMHPEPANKIDDIEAKINKWKEDLRYLAETGDKGLDEEQKKAILISIVPEDIADHLIKKHDEYADYDDYEEELMKIISRNEMKSDKKTKTIGQIQDHDHDNEPHNEDQVLYYWDEGQGGF